MATGASKTDDSQVVLDALKAAGEHTSKGSVRIFGYVRVSTDTQTVDLQVDALTAAGVPRNHIVEEVGSGYALGARPRRDELLSHLRAGDRLVIWRLDRLGRSLSEIVQITDRFVAEGIELQSLTDGVDPSTPAGKMMLGVMASMAEYERNLISERTKAGLAATRRRGTRLGRPGALTPRGLDAVLIMTQAGRTVEEISDGLGVSKSTVDRARRALRDQGKLA